MSICTGLWEREAGSASVSVLRDMCAVTCALWPQVRRYDHLRWLVLRDMHSQLVQQGVIPPSEHLANPLCHTDYMLYSRGAPVPRNMTVVIAAGGNLNVLQTLVVQFCAIRFVHSILVLPKVRV